MCSIVHIVFAPRMLRPGAAGSLDVLTRVSGNRPDPGGSAGRMTCTAQDEGGSLARRYDPQRRARIIAAAYQSIAERGVRGTSNRVVAGMCDVPLGSLTYHFSNIDEMLMEAFSLYVEQVKSLVRERLVPEMTFDEAVDAVVALIHDDFRSEDLNYNINYELYTMASRDVGYQRLLIDMTEAGQRALTYLFGEQSAYAINTYIEGATTHIALHSAPQGAEQTRRDIRLLAGGLGRSSM